MIIKQVDAKDTYPIRNIMLRPGAPVTEAQFDGDQDEQTFHLGAFVDEKLASVASFYLKNNDSFLNPYQYQLRGMATLEKFQKQGLSGSLLKTAFPIIKRNHVHLLWCNARVGAIGFYEKAGFIRIGKEFDIPGIGAHVLMSLTF